MGEQTFVARAQRFGTNDTAKVRQTVTDTVPWGRLGVPMDIAKGVVFLASDDAGYMNGAGPVVDGGRRRSEARARTANNDEVRVTISSLASLLERVMQNCRQFCLRSSPR
jgi:Enoyl-(Acyl carrier protein) reductase